MEPNPTLLNERFLKCIIGRVIACWLAMMAQTSLAAFSGLLGTYLPSVALNTSFASDFIFVTEFGPSPGF